MKVIEHDHEMTGPSFYRSPPEFLVCVLLLTISSVRTEVYEPIQWSPLNPKFIFTRDQFENGEAYYRMSVLLLSKINFVCPNPTTGFGTMTNSIAIQELNENLWIVDKSSFDSCDIDTTKKDNKRLMQCRWKVYSSNSLQHKQIVFAQYSPIVGGLQFEPGREYYFIATSNGLASSINSTSRGHCRDKEKGVSMRVVFYICRNTLDCLSNASDTTPVTNATDSTPVTPYITPAAAVGRSQPSETPMHLAIVFGVAFGLSAVANAILFVCYIRKSHRTNRQDEEDGSQLTKLMSQDTFPSDPKNGTEAPYDHTNRQFDEIGSEVTKTKPQDPPPSDLISETEVLTNSNRQDEENGSQPTKPKPQFPPPSVQTSGREAPSGINRRDKKEGSQVTKPRLQCPPPSVQKSESGSISRRDGKEGSQVTKPKPKPKPQFPPPSVQKSGRRTPSSINRRDGKEGGQVTNSKPKRPPPSVPKTRREVPKAPAAARA